MGPILSNSGKVSIKPLPAIESTHTNLLRLGLLILKRIRGQTGGHRVVARVRFEVGEEVSLEFGGKEPRLGACIWVART